jgi:hypothetical protein
VEDRALEGLSLLRVYGDEDEAGSAREFLAGQSVQCTILDERFVNPASLGNAAPGLWLLVLQTHRADAEARLAAREAEGDACQDAEASCAGCSSRDFSAVPPRDAPRGSWYLRCVNCGRWTPVSGKTYLREEYPVLPPACPECGSFRIGGGEPPEFDMGNPEEKKWWRCENCENNWAAVTDPKGSGLAGFDGSREPWRCETLERLPPELLEPPAEEPEQEDETEDCDKPKVGCPKCLSCDVSMNDTLVAKGGPVRFLCKHCGQVWDVAVPAGTPLPDIPVIRDGDATEDPAIACVQCGSADTEPCDAPTYAFESGLSRIFKMIFDHTSWRRCRHCGYQWEAQI